MTSALAVQDFRMERRTGGEVGSILPATEARGLWRMELLGKQAFLQIEMSSQPPLRGAR